MKRVMISAMKQTGPLILLIGLALVVVWFVSARQAREQTAFLERAADAFEHTRQIPPDTETAIHNAIDAIRWRSFSFGKALKIRQTQAMDRIQAAYLVNGGPYYVPSE
jgi:hypothetical protein